MFTLLQRILPLLCLLAACGGPADVPCRPVAAGHALLPCGRVVADGERLLIDEVAAALPVGEAVDWLMATRDAPRHLLAKLRLTALTTLALPHLRLTVESLQIERFNGQPATFDSRDGSWHQPAEEWPCGCIATRCAAAWGRGVELACGDAPVELGSFLAVPQQAAALADARLSVTYRYTFFDGGGYCWQRRTCHIPLHRLTDGWPMGGCIEYRLCIGGPPASPAPPLAHDGWQNCCVVLSVED